MTNEEAKTTAIKDAFGLKWKWLPPSMQQHILNVHHWVDRSRNRMALSPGDLGFDEATECERHCEFWRPIALKGIEDNNGWTRIEPDRSNLPDKATLVDIVLIEFGKQNIYRALYNPIAKEFTSMDIVLDPTHYAIVEERELPVY